MQTKTYKLPKEFTVVRRRWARGLKEETRLYYPLTRKMCCLGFACRAAGLNTKDLSFQLAPSSTGCIIGGLSKADDGRANGVGDTSLTAAAMRINDDSALDDATREKRLTALFARRGYRIPGRARRTERHSNQGR